MVKISFIGAGSRTFLRVIFDILTFKSLTKDLVLCLEDVNSERVDLIYKLIKLYLEKYNKELKLDGVSLVKTTDQKKAIENAKYVISAIQVGGLDAYKQDLDIPFKYGVTQNVGDTLGPGGVFRFLRTTAQIQSIVEDMNNLGFNSELKYDKPMFLNYTNPMAMVTWLCNVVVPDSTIGLCHGIFQTAYTMRKWIGVKWEDFSYFCAGINHMAWFLEVWYKNSEGRWEDAYPLIHKTFKEKPEALHIHTGIRYDMMKATSFYMTESDGHLSEYLPYYRKRQDLLEKFKREGLMFGSLRHNNDYETQTKNHERMDKRIIDWIEQDTLPLQERPSQEYASHIIDARERNKPFKFYGNILNKNQGLITNLPSGCCVEVPIFVDGHGIHPQGGIELPTVCQALCTSNIMVQKATIEGYLDRDKEKIYQAILLDPNTASISSPEKIHEMVNEMFQAEAKWLPKFN